MSARAPLLAGIFVAIAAAAFPILQRNVVAQGRQRAFYVGVVDQAGAPASDLGPKDFIVKEDNVAREILKVEPAVDPISYDGSAIACLIDSTLASVSRWAPAESESQASSVPLMPASPMPTCTSGSERDFSMASEEIEESFLFWHQGPKPA